MIMSVHKFSCRLLVGVHSCGLLVFCLFVVLQSLQCMLLILKTHCYPQFGVHIHKGQDYNHMVVTTIFISLQTPQQHASKIN